MATTFPLPTRSRYPNSFEYKYISNVFAHTSPFTKGTDTIEMPGALFAFQAGYLNLSGTDLARLEAFLASMNGMAGRFDYIIPRRQLGTVTGVGTLNATVNQGGKSAVVNSVGSNRTVLAGDFFTIGGEVKRATADAVAGVGGQIVIPYAPAQRKQVAGGAVITFAPNAFGTFMLTGNEHGSPWRSGGAVGVMGDIIIDAVEANT